jgi:porphobilinogen synthase
VEFPKVRLRRLRETPVLRRMARESRLSPDNLIMPFFVVHGRGVRQAITSMPGVSRLSIDVLIKEATQVKSLGVPAVILFGIPKKKDARASEAVSPSGIVQQAVRAVKDRVPDLVVITDVCLCEYMDHGHCGVVRKGRIENDPTLDLLARSAVSHARAGADVVAPSDMMDGRVGAIRSALDESNYGTMPIISYSAKYASVFYGPFREAADSTPAFGDRRSYQMDPANAREALREMDADVREGADVLMVKPAMPCLDILARARMRFDLPLAAYQVSGEYAMIRAAGKLGWLDERRAMIESLTAIHRAGADLILTYFAMEAARVIIEGGSVG